MPKGRLIVPRFTIYGRVNQTYYVTYNTPGKSEKYTDQLYIEIMSFTGVLRIYLFDRWRRPGGGTGKPVGNRLIINPLSHRNIRNTKP